MQTQAQLEYEMYAHGRQRADRIMHTNEEQGRSDSNPYTKILHRRFVLPLADIIRQDQAVKTPGMNKAHVKLLAALDPDAVAFLAVRNVLNCLLNSTDSHTARTVVNAVGKSAFHELLLALFKEVNPALFFTIANSLDRRMSKSERHRMTVFKMQAKANGVPVPEWGSAGVTQVGSYLVNALEGLGLIETIRTKAKNRQGIDIQLHPDILSLIDTVKGMVKETMPYFLPCVEQPRDWTAIDDGGWHTNEMRRMQPYAVASTGAWADVAEGETAIPLRAINALQRTRWQVNGVMLATVRQVAKHFDMDEIVSQAELPRPARPLWLTDAATKDDMTPGQLEEFVLWKGEQRNWHTEMKLRGTRYGRLASALNIATKFQDCPVIYFVYFADFRGRLYPNTTGISPQGSDLQKALLRFAVGKPLDTTEAEQWFLINGANKWGYDKDSLAGRVRWVEARHDLIMDFAEDPISNSAWREADKPLQFLAWCMEYAAWRNAPHSFISHLPIGMDGSCNGLQNFSAMLRDEVGGEATNLVPGDLPQDIYQRVADVTALKLRQMPPDEEGFRDKWLGHGMNRSIVKRSVMTLPYGSTRFACSTFIVEDYLRHGKAPQFAREEYSRAATYLSHLVWEAIGEVVLKASEAMDWLQTSATTLIKRGLDSISWTSPSGFPVIQRYQKTECHRIRTSLCGNAFLRLATETDEADRAKHRNGIAPNFVHSHDASHLHLATVAAAVAGMDLAMVHDDYGTHAADTPQLARIIRETFVAMYEDHAPLEEFAAKYDLPAPPTRGSLHLRDVLHSTYFFS